MNDGASLDDIAGSLIAGDATDASSSDAKSVPADKQEEHDLPMMGTDDDDSLLDDTDDQPVDEQDDEASDEQDDEVLSDDDENDEEDTDTSDDDIGGSDTKPVLDINEDDLIEVMIDGELQHRTIGDAMKALSGEGAIEKRLTEATEERKAAHAERTAWQQQRDTETTTLVNAFNALSEVMYQPRVKEPDEALRTTNAQKYLLEKDAYETEVRRIQGLQGQVEQLFGKIRGEIDDGVKAYRKDQQKILASKLPVLTDKKLGPVRKKAILDAAAHYGFAPEEINMASDHRLFLMAHDAALYRAGKSKQKDDPVKTGKQTRKIPRTLRSGTVSKAKNRARNKQKQRDQAKAKAQKTGKVDDIANMIMR